MFVKNGWHCVIRLVVAAFSSSLSAHSADTNKVAWQACDTKVVSENCSFENANSDVYRGTCQLMSDSLMCVRNRPIEKSAAASANDETTASKVDLLHDLEHLFKGAKVEAGPSLVDCTLSGGTKARCFSITVKAEPSSYTPGPWCPETINDGAEAAGIWLESGVAYDVDGAFIESMASFYGDSQWQLYDKGTGKINVTDTLESCAAAARPNVDPAYQNHCVQCLPGYISEDASVTYTIPIKSYPLFGKTQ